MQGVLDWLSTGTGAEWALLLTSVLVWLVGGLVAWRRRERPPKVIVQEINRTKLLDIHPSQRERLSVIYTSENGVEVGVHDLEQKELVIYNNGTRNIGEGLAVELRVQDMGSSDGSVRGFWRWFSDDPRYGSIPFEESKSVEGHRGHIATGISIELPYLNSYPVHRDYVMVYLLSDGELNISLWRRRAGKGWSARFISLHRLEKWQRRASQITVLISGVMAVIGALAMRAVDGEPSPAAPLGLLVLFFAVLLSWVGPPVARALSRRCLGGRAPSEFAGNRGE